MPAVLAPAKVNLYLEVVSRRPDGYHELRTLFQTLDWGDRVEVERTEVPGVLCEVTGEMTGKARGVEGLPTDDRNLAVAAAKAYLAEAKLAGGVRVRLEKRIPVGGGLGGGSSDAAAVLRALESDARALGPQRLLEVARSLGSDVPFLLAGGTATATGRGDVVSPLPAAPSLSVVLLSPPFGTDTARVYAHADARARRAPNGGLARAVQALASGVPARVREAHHNDLAIPAMTAYPDLRHLASDAERLLGRPLALTGSGSTLYDVPDVGEVGEVLARLRPLGARLVVAATA